MITAKRWFKTQLALYFSFNYGGFSSLLVFEIMNDNLASRLTSTLSHAMILKYSQSFVQSL